MVLVHGLGQAIPKSVGVRPDSIPTHMPKLIVITGLCGSGKTRYIRTIRASIPGLIADDYMTRAASPRFIDSRFYVDLVRTLNAGKDCLVCDIAFCRPGQRAAFEAVIRPCAPAVEFEWVFFANEPELCLQNVRRRARIKVGAEEQSIRALSRHYQIPGSATVLPVWRPAPEPQRRR